MFDRVKKVIDCIDFTTIDGDRKEELNVLTEFIQKTLQADKPLAINFICTHNSRRSQFSQLWAKLAGEYYEVEVDSFSGGVEVTSFNERVAASIKRFGFEVDVEGVENPLYLIRWRKDQDSFPMFSKLYDDESNPSTGFAAVMTCAHADENCPVVLGCEQRIAIRYTDPKKYDDTVLEQVMYDYRSFQIATEMFYVFSRVRK